MEANSQTLKTNKTQTVDSCADKNRLTFASTKYPSKNICTTYNSIKGKMKCN